MKRSGVADLPLHGGRVPPWLASRMTALGTAISEAVLRDYGSSELLSRLSHPFWFQALGCVMGMDWHSSGITTSVLGALKRGLNPRANELGIYVCGGRGRHSRNTPDELRSVAERASLNGDALVRASRLTARIDNNAIADGFQIYLHSFIVTAESEWVVVQQGLNDATGRARRYHWHSAFVRDFVTAPHAGIVGEHQGTIIQYVGDEIYAAFGVPAPIPEHAARAVACGMAFQRVAPAINERLAQIGIPAIRYGVGIESGEVVAALVGSEARRQYGVNGDAVNVAARLCAAAPAGEVWITSDVLRRLDRPPQVDDIGVKPFKNVAREVHVFRLEWQ